MAQLSPYLFSSALNFPSGPSSPTDYMGAYQSALSLNQQLYGNVMGGYNQLAQAQYAAQQPIQQGYNQLTGDVLNTIQGIGASQQQAIQDAYAQQSGGAAQQLVSSGLGNTTVMNSVQRGLMLDKQKADIALANQMAQLTAGYQSQLGSQALNYGNQANMQNVALGTQKLGAIQAVNAPYPNVQPYLNYAMMQGALKAGVPGIGALNAARGGAATAPPYSMRTPQFGSQEPTTLQAPVTGVAGPSSYTGAPYSGQNLDMSEAYGLPGGAGDWTSQMASGAANYVANAASVYGQPAAQPTYQSLVDQQNQPSDLEAYGALPVQAADEGYPFSD